MKKVFGWIHSVIYSDYDVEGNEFAEVHVRVRPDDMSVDEIDLLRKTGKVISYVIRGKDLRGEPYRELRIRYTINDIRKHLREKDNLLVDLEFSNKKLLAVLLISERG
ncbi:MAG: hypothetical protein KAW92_11730 [Candidatus Cloacimonetes bacterium]|nr:hypothetical protein [Candidatus Cloacimonadota bacterium]